MVYKYTSIALRLLFAALFTISAYTKLIEINIFAESLNSYAILPKSAVSLFAYYVPLLEVGLAVGFLLPGFTVPNAVLTVVVIVVFQVALISLLVRGIEIDCACFGRFATSPKAALIRNFIILGLASILLFSVYKLAKLQKCNGES